MATTTKQEQLTTTKQQYKPKVAKHKKQVKKINSTLKDKGICTGTSRVRLVLTNDALNPIEYHAIKALEDAKNADPQVPISELSSDVQSVIKRAEKQYVNDIRNRFNKMRVSSLEDINDYNAKRKEAKKTDKKFNIHLFNKSYGHNGNKFYALWKKYLNSQDKLRVGLTKKTKNGEFTIDEWTRAIYLIKKTRVRLSDDTRNIIASFMDTIIEQYAINGIINCAREKRNIILLRHALEESEGFNERAPIHRYVKSMHNYDNAVQWIKSCTEHNNNKSTGKTSPKYARVGEFLDEPKDFVKYIIGICHYAQMSLAAKEKDKEVAKYYLNMSINLEFKRFCSYIIYETILRLGGALKCIVNENNVKTISNNMVYHAINLIHVLNGVHSDTVNLIKQRVNKFKKFKAKAASAKAASAKATDE